MTNLNGNLNFDATDVPQAQAFDPLPPGWYRMRIVGAEIAESETAGQMLKIEHEIDETAHPQHRGRKVYSNLCINHPTSDKARDIARRTLSSIAHAIGKLKLGDTNDLLGALVQVKLKVEPARDQYEARNAPTGYRPIGSDEGQESAAPTTAKATAPATATAAPKWKK